MKVPFILLLLLTPFLSFCQDEGDVEFTVKKKLVPDTVKVVNAFCYSLQNSEFKPLAENQRRDYYQSAASAQIELVIYSNDSCLVRGIADGPKKQKRYYIGEQKLYYLISGNKILLSGKNFMNEPIVIEGVLKKNSLEIDNSKNLCVALFGDLLQAVSKRITLTACDL